MNFDHPTDFETDLGKFFNELAKESTKDNLRISVYTNEFDLSLFKILYPEITSKDGYIEDSFCFIDDHISNEIARRHKICIVRNPINNFSHLEDILDNKKFYGKYAILFINSSSFNITNTFEESDLRQGVAETKYLTQTLTSTYPQSLYVAEKKSQRKKAELGDLYDLDYTSIHWGQRKLYLSELDFLTLCVDFVNTEKYTIVYAGAANGEHIPLLQKQFPNIEFHLYDPAPFCDEILEHPDIYKINPRKDSKLPLGFFTDEVAKTYKGVDNLLFICDIRLAPNQNEKDYDKVFEENVNNDMTYQYNWVKIMQPKYSILKLRFPYDKLKYKYLSGKIRFQAWAPVSSTETRLIVKQNADEIEYDCKKYELQCAYFNNQMRLLDISNVKMQNLDIDVDGIFSDIWRKYKIPINADCFIETKIITSYLTKLGKEISIKNIQQMIDTISSHIYKKLAKPEDAFAKKINLNKRKS